MQLSVTFRHMNSQEALKDYAYERVSRLKKFLDHPLEAQVILSVEKFRHIAEVTILGDGVSFNGEESSGDMFSAIDLVMGKIERQARKYHKKIREHKSNTSIKTEFQAEQDMATESFEEDQEPTIIERENFFAKPMSVDEAVMQLGLIDDNFLVFTNDSTKRINVIYKRKDGHYGLIDPNQ
ncbi:MAG: ribosome-associated translation inhibitor RaiA [Deltaproteobacteria bacterium]|nr:ribosome-associated translation inhibitor RaiA [Deltaproteobacteria bacterium]